MKRVSVILTIILLFCQPIAAQESEQALQEKTQKQKTEKGVSKIPTKFGVEIGTNLVSIRSKIDPNLPVRVEPVFVSGFNILNDSLKLDTNFQRGGLNKFGGIHYELAANGNIFRFKNVGIGPSAYLTSAKEHTLFIENRGFTADNLTEKDYGLVGFNIRYGHVDKMNIRASYMLGATYIREHGVFKFSGSNETIKKLYNKDVLPIDMFAIESSLPNLGRIEINGIFRSIQTKNMVNHSNTKEFVPPRQKILEGSTNIRLWPYLYLSLSGTLTNSGYSPAFLGNSCGAKIGLRF